MRTFTRKWDGNDPATSRSAAPVSRREGTAAARPQRSTLPDINQSPRMLAQRRALLSTFGSAIRLPDEEPNELAAPFAAPIQRATADEGVDPLGAGHSQPQSKRALNRTGLPDSLRSGVESLSGLSLDDVKVHYNSSKPAQLQASAYAQGTDIHLAPGQEKHLPHETWHVVQQKQGRVGPTRQLQSIGVNDDASLEREADVMGAKALRTSLNADIPATTSVQSPGAARTVQRVSPFSKWFIQNIMPAVLALVPGIDEPNYFLRAQEFLKIDDSKDDPWEVAIGFLFTVFMNLIPATEYESGLESLAAIRGKLFAGIAELPSHRESAHQVEIQITELEDTYRSNLTDEEVLQEARGYVSAQKDAWKKGSPETYSDVLLSGASYLLLNPSSTSHYLDERTDRPLSHGQQKDASQYHRSAKHSLFSSTSAKQVKGEVVRKPAIKQKFEGGGGEAHVGLYPNTLTHRRNRDMPAKPKSRKVTDSGGKKNLEKPEDEIVAPKTSLGESDLYDASLEYKLMLSQRVADHTQGLTYLKVGVYNEYPLVMVHFDLGSFLGQYLKGLSGVRAPSDGTKKAFTSFLMNYYMGLANYLAKSAGVNITIVERSSFGFNTPSVSETGESFRINMGLMPPVYANVQAHALSLLDAQLGQLLKRKAPRDPGKHKLNTSADYLAGKKADIDGISDWLAFALYPIESKGKTSIANAVRKRESLDFVNARSFNLMAHFGGKIASLGDVMAELFNTMSVGTSLSTDVDPDQTRYLYDVPGSKKDYPVDAKATGQYKRLLSLIQRHLVEIAVESKDEELSNKLISLVPLLNSVNSHIELTLDLVNELLLIEAMSQVRGKGDSGPLGDGYGSESEVEEESDDDERAKDESLDSGTLTIDLAKKPTKRLLTTKKIITHNGMRALLCAIDSSVKVVYEDKERLNVDIQGAYYEMSDALKAASVKAQVTQEPNEAHVLVRDINACVTVGPKGKGNIQTDLTSSPATVWIIDTTSSTQRQMRSLVEAYRIAAHVKVLYLVSSGFKQEQFGADRNPYGTIRAFTDKNPAGKAMLNDILNVTRNSDRPLAVTAHLYRRLMKSFGAVPRSKNLLSKSKSVHDPVDLSLGLGKGSEDDDRWNFDFDFNAHFEEVQARDESLRALRRALEHVDQQGDDVNAHLADHSHQASEFIYAGPSSKEAASGREKSRASKAWFNMIENPGGGDCVLHALAGRTLEFKEILVRRGELADAADGVIGPTVSGSHIYQSLYQSGFLSAEMSAALHGKHQVPRSVYQSAIRVPGLYAGEEEIRIHCSMHGTPDAVWVVTDQGELRRVTTGGAEAIATVSVVGEAAFQQQIRQLTDAGSVVLFKSPNHWERITGVR